LFVKKWTTAEGAVVKGYKLVTDTQEHTIAFLTGNLVAFLVAILAIRFFINYLKSLWF
jgi:undecaprenyl-diphosphatase